VKPVDAALAALGVADVATGPPTCCLNRALVDEAVAGR
jgi:hypothetical protein